MPKAKILKKDKLDRFYTRDTVAKKCVDIYKSFNLPCKHIVEPSAGGGAFVRAAKKLNRPIVAMDLAPACEGVIQQDWFEADLSALDTVTVLGNPPFGERNSLSIKFIKHALSFDTVNVIAFILPAVWNKPTLQKVFPSNWRLIHASPVEPDAFLLFGESYNVVSTFQIWAKDVDLPDLRWPTNPQVETEDFLFSTPDEADFFILGAAPATVIAPTDVSPTQRGYYIKSKGEEIHELVSRFQAINWAEFGQSSVSGGVFWMTKPEIVRAYLIWNC